MNYPSRWIGDETPDSRVPPRSPAGPLPIVIGALSGAFVVGVLWILVG